MCRSPRAELAGGIHHVYSRGAVRQEIFRDDLDRRRYLALLARATRRMSWRCLTYCLMGNHMHLLIETPEPNLGRGMQWFHGTYAQAFNRRHAGSGHVFQGRFESNGIASDPQFWVTVRYILHNPIKAGLCATPAAWPWSSHALLAAGTPPSCLDEPRLYSYFESMGGDPQRRYFEYVEVALPNLKGSGPFMF
jgi:REP element-mobilizing transposase RayT